MPELPEVETTKRGLIPHLVNQQIKGITIYQSMLRYPVDASLKTRLIGQTITDITREAKYLCIHLPNGTLLIHLGMSGSLKILPAAITKQTHDHFELLFANHTVLRLNDPRRFGAVLWQPPGTLNPRLQHLGVEPLSDAFNGSYLYRASRNRKKDIKALIMDNHCVVGVGNIYACESLFLSGIHPQKKAHTLTKKHCLQLTKAIKTVLNQAITAGGTTLKDFTQVSGKAGYFQQQLAVYGRQNQPCHRCQQSIVKIKQGTRASYFCPSCQTK